MTVMVHEPSPKKYEMSHQSPPRNAMKMTRMTTVFRLFAAIALYMKG